jgi:hypothetical protein
MEKPWKFITDTHSDDFCRGIAAEMMRLFGITEAEAIGRINQGWGHLGEFHSIAYHKPAEYWAHHMYFGHDSYWWIRDEATRKRLGLGPVEPLPYP